MVRRLIHIAINFALACLLLAAIGKLDAFLKNPIITTLLVGFHIKDKLISWGASMIVGWLIGIVITGYIVLCIVEVFSFIYKKSRRTIQNFGK